MKKIKINLLIIASLLIGGGAAWMLRGVYDKLFMMEGVFHIVNSAGQNYKVILTFPSGKHIGFNLEKNGIYEFQLPDTGEGAISVSIDGKERDKVGYVTSMNGITVLVIGEKETEFSQIFP